MNHRGGLALIRSTWLSWMQYRSFFFILAFGWMVPPLVAMFVWMAAAGDGEVAGFQRSVFVAYYLVLILVNQLTYSQSNWTVGDIIREGTLNHWLIRPLSPLYQILSSEIAGKVVYLVFTFPIVLILMIILKPSFSFTASQFLIFWFALILAWALRFVWGLWIALLAFWSTRADALLALQDSLVFIFSGMIAPVALLPGFLQNLATFLPFRYMIGFPVEILTSDLSYQQMMQGLLIQSIWLIIAVAACWLVWRKGISRYSAIGG
ncbi:MAG TPA: ABC-2 family transporter protein [Anaerolineaceae bacterium]|nr:ABC-2 family transporter protein [Anaerolineaceae bacterium]